MSPLPRGRGRGWGRAEGGARPAPEAAVLKGPGGRWSGVCRRAGLGRAGLGRARQGRGRAVLRSPPQRRPGGARGRPVPSRPALPPPCRRRRARDHAAGAAAAPPRSSARLPLPGDAASPHRRQGCLLPPRRPPALRWQVQPLHGRLQPAARQARGQAQVSDPLRGPRPRNRQAGTGHRSLSTGSCRASLTGHRPRAQATASGLSIPEDRLSGAPRGGYPTPGTGCGTVTQGSATGTPWWILRRRSHPLQRGVRTAVPCGTGLPVGRVGCPWVFLGWVHVPGPQDGGCGVREGRVAVHRARREGTRSGGNLLVKHRAARV